MNRFPKCLSVPVHGFLGRVASVLHHSIFKKVFILSWQIPFTASCDGKTSFNEAPVLFMKHICELQINKYNTNSTQETGSLKP